MSPQKDKLPVRTAGIDSFLRKVESTRVMKAHGRKPGRLAFIIDATASRQPTWEQARQIQARMFMAVDKTAALNLQLIYFRGVDEFYYSSWKDEPGALLREMSGVMCLAGQTQIGRSLRHVLAETRQNQVAAAVYIGDACEEACEPLYNLAGKLRIHATPVFMFQEYRQPGVAAIYQSIARLSGGAYSGFDATSPGLLSELLAAVAVYATGGRDALKSFARGGSPQVQAMTSQLLT